MNCAAVDRESMVLACNFLGNTLLTPPRFVAPVGLRPSFWEEFPAFEDDAVAAASARLASWVAEREEMEEDALLQRLSVEYALLFLGPPRPAAPPWETLYLVEGSKVGFGEPAQIMRRLLGELGLKVTREHNQYPDHIGIELLYLGKLWELSGERGDAVCGLAPTISDFAAEHPLTFVGKLAAKAREATTEGYYALILELAEALLRVMAADQEAA